MKKTLICIICTFLCYLPIHSQEKDYKNEIGATYGIAFFNNDETTTYNLNYTRLLTPNIGLKSGITFYGTEFLNAKWGMKIPAYAIFRTKSATRNEDDIYNPDNTVFEDIIYSILSVIPANFELSVGPSFGYIIPANNAKNLSFEQKAMNNEYFPYKKFTLTLDANTQICINIHRVGVLFNGGGGYSLTKNFKYYTNKPYNPDDGKTARWNGQIQFGASYKF